MDRGQIEQVRSFHRLVTRRAGALDTSYLKRGRPLGEARLVFEIGVGGAEARELRERLGLDSGYLSRLLGALKRDGLIELRRSAFDARQRRATLTRKGKAELASYDRISNRLAASILESLEESQRGRLVAAMVEVERLLRAGAVAVAIERPDSEAARWCLAQYFAELAARFDAGFDSGADRSASPEELAPPKGAFLIARLDGRPVGCGALKTLDAETGEIKRLWTAPSARGLGVARRVLRRLEEEARRRGFKRLRLDTNRALNEARAFYLKQGYRDIPRYSDNPYAHFWFEKRL